MSVPLSRALVVLPNWYGETLFATPLLRALARQRPDAFVAVLGVARCREVLTGNPDVHEFLELADARGVRAFLGQGGAIARLRQGRFDAAILLRPSLSRALLLARAGIPVRAGFAQPKSAWLLTHRCPLPPRTQHKALEYLPLLATLGLRPDEGRCRYVVTEPERQAARRLLGSLGLDGRPFAALHPGANWAHKRWPAERFSALGDRLAAAGAAILVTNGAEDAALADTVAGAMRQPARRLPAGTPLRASAACLEQAQLVVTNDTGIAHVAAALKRPLLALFGPTSPAYTGPLGEVSRTRVLHHPGCCPAHPCLSESPPHEGMASISVEEAAASALALWADHAVRAQR